MPTDPTRSASSSWTDPKRRLLFQAVLGLIAAVGLTEILITPGIFLRRNFQQQVLGGDRGRDAVITTDTNAPPAVRLVEQLFVDKAAREQQVAQARWEQRSRLAESIRPHLKQLSEDLLLAQESRGQLVSALRSVVGIDVDAKTAQFTAKPPASFDRLLLKEPTAASAWASLRGSLTSSNEAITRGRAVELEASARLANDRFDENEALQLDAAAKNVTNSASRMVRARRDLEHLSVLLKAQHSGF